MKIEILGKAEDKIKMDEVAKLIKQAATGANVPVEVILSHKFQAFSGHSFNPSKTPVVFIDGFIEFAGIIPKLSIVTSKLIEIRDKGSQTF